MNNNSNNIDKKTSWGERSLFGLQFQTVIHHWRKTGQEFKQGRVLEEDAEAEAREGDDYWLASHGFLRLFPYKTQDGTHNGLGPLPLITN